MKMSDDLKEYCSESKSKAKELDSLLSEIGNRRADLEWQNEENEREWQVLSSLEDELLLLIDKYGEKKRIPKK